MVVSLKNAKQQAQILRAFHMVVFSNAVEVANSMGLDHTLIPQGLIASAGQGLLILRDQLPEQHKNIAQVEAEMCVEAFCGNLNENGFKLPEFKATVPQGIVVKSSELEKGGTA